MFENKTLQNGTIIIFTAISNKMSGLNSECLKMFNLEQINKKCPTLLNAKALKLFYGMLERYGIREVYYYKDIGAFEKHYGYFQVSEKQ